MTNYDNHLPKKAKDLKIMLNHLQLDQSQKQQFPSKTNNNIRRRRQQQQQQRQSQQQYIDIIIMIQKIRMIKRGKQKLI